MLGHEIEEMPLGHHGDKPCPPRQTTKVGDLVNTAANDRSDRLYFVMSAREQCLQETQLAKEVER